nr:ATP-binding protein [uncultured Roseateles sp.]
MQKIKQKMRAGLSRVSLRGKAALGLLAAGTLLLPTGLLAQASTALEPAALQLGFSAALAQQWLTGMLLVLSIMSSIVAKLYRREAQLSCLGSMMLAGVAYQVLHYASPAPVLWLQAACVLTLALVLNFGAQYLLRQLAVLQPRLEQLMWLQTLFMPASLLLAGGSFGAWLSQAWHGLLILELLALLAWYLRQRWQALHSTLPVDEGASGDLRWLSLLLGLSGAALLGELVLDVSLAPEAALRWSLWLGLGLPLIMVGLCLHFCAGFARARRDSDLQQIQLEQRMGERVAEMERNFASSVEQKLEQVTERERKRIAADLHDDLGAKLLTIVHTSESDRISTLAREALEEMRLSVRGLTGKPVQLLDALGDWRAEVVSRLGQANILAEWKAPAEDVEHTLPARAYVQTTRIFREAVSNIIKHSGGTHCTVSCNVQGGDFQVVIQDNGQGIPAELDGRLDRGHGMASMKSRAKQMHGQCLVESGPGWGTVIRLTIPL